MHQHAAAKHNLNSWRAVRCCVALTWWYTVGCWQSAASGSLTWWYTVGCWQSAANGSLTWWYTVGCWQSAANGSKRCKLTLTDFHGRYTQQSLSNPDKMWRAIVRVAWEFGHWEGKPVIFVTCKSSALKAKLFYLKIKYWA